MARFCGSSGMRCFCPFLLAPHAFLSVFCPSLLHTHALFFYFLSWPFFTWLVHPATYLSVKSPLISCLFLFLAPTQFFSSAPTSFFFFVLNYPCLSPSAFDQVTTFLNRVSFRKRRGMISSRDNPYS